MARRGRPTKDEHKKILELAGTQSPEQIAESLGRTPEGIRGVIAQHTGADADRTTQAEVAARADFRKTPEWRELKRQFTAGELEYFESRYADWMSQLKDDITASESTQIFILLKTEILMNRILEQKKQLTEVIAANHKELTALLSVAEPTEAERLRRLSLQDGIALARQQYGDLTNDLVKLQKEHADLMKQLKATRDQRITRLENTKTSFIDVLKELMDAEVREREGRHMALVQLAATKEKARLAEFHTYVDGSVDRPILNAETVLLDEPK